MYFAIIGKNPQLSLLELKLLQPQNIQRQGTIITFHTDHADKLAKLGGVIKRGVIITADQLGRAIQDSKIIGTQDIQRAKQLKKQYGIKRFKQVDLFHTDRDIVKNGKEIVKIDTEHYGIVQGYQNIRLYEVIDFDKPGRDMHMGMMPSKLTHMLINLAIQHISDKEIPYIYDPFCGSGTTLFLTNRLGYPSCGSDIDTKYMDINVKRRDKQYFKSGASINYFQHDITTAIPPKQKYPCNLVVSEGRLGPIVYQKTTASDIARFMNQVQPIYQAAIQYCHQHFGSIPMVYTIPYYLKFKASIADQLKIFAQKLGYQTTVLQDIYHRSGQNVGRQICIFTPTK